MDIKQYWTVLRHWSQFVPNTSKLTSKDMKLYFIIIIPNIQWPSKTMRTLTQSIALNGSGRPLSSVLGLGSATHSMILASVTGNRCQFLGIVALELQVSWKKNHESLWDCVPVSGFHCSVVIWALKKIVWWKLFSLCIAWSFSNQGLAWISECGWPVRNVVDWLFGWKCAMTGSLKSQLC